MLRNLTILPVVGEPGLIAYECVKCRYVRASLSRGALCAETLHQPIDRCAADLEGLGDLRRAEPFGLHCADLTALCSALQRAAASKVERIHCGEPGEQFYTDAIGSTRASFHTYCKLSRAARNAGCTLHVNGHMAAPGVLSVPSKLENYRAKAKEFARLAVAAKSLRDGRRYRKLAEMYWALALGQEPEHVHPSKARAEASPT